MDGNKLYLMGLVSMSEPDDSPPEHAQQDANIIEDDTSFDGFDDLLTPPGEMEMQESRPLLKIFTGMHRDAQLHLSDGAYRIGSSDDCDIILKDAGIAANHLVLNCINGHFSVAPEQGAVYIDGSPVTVEQVQLNLKTIVTIGSVHWGLEIGDETWQPDSFPTIVPVTSAPESDIVDKQKPASLFARC